MRPMHEGGRVVTTRTRMPRSTDLVRYVSPFGSPATMARREAEMHLAWDDACWREWGPLGMLDGRMRRIGPPRIEEPKR